MAEKHKDGIHQLTLEDLFGAEFGTDKKKIKDTEKVKKEQDAPRKRKIAAAEKPGKQNTAVKKDIQKKTQTPKKSISKTKKTDNTFTGMPEPIDTVIGKETPPAPPIKKRHRRTKAEMEAARQEETGKNPENKSDIKTSKTPEQADISDKKEKQAQKKPTDPEENVVYMKETPCPFRIGECVSLIYTKRLYTVLSINGNTVRCVQNEGEGFECTMACSDLRHSDKPAREGVIKKEESK